MKYLCELINKKDKKANVKPFMVKNYLWVFVNCLVENPAFDSQTKDTLTLRASAFGSKCELPEPFLKKVANCGVVDHVLSFASFKANKELKKGDGAKRQRLTGGWAGGQERGCSRGSGSGSGGAWCAAAAKLPSWAVIVAATQQQSAKLLQLTASAPCHHPHPTLLSPRHPQAGRRQRRRWPQL